MIKSNMQGKRKGTKKVQEMRKQNKKARETTVWRKKTKKGETKGARDGV